MSDVWIMLPWNTEEAVDGCDECNRQDEWKPWPIYTISYLGIECCASCLTPMYLPRKRQLEI